MRIMQISGALAGAQKIIEEAIHGYALEQGHESCVLYACGTPSMEKEICYERKIENLLTRGLRKFVAKNPHFSLLQTLRLIREIERFAPDIVHLHVLHHGYTDFPLLLKYLAKKEIAVVYTMHDMWAFTGGCYHYLSRKCNGYQSGCHECPALKQELDIAKCLVPQSRYQKEKLLQKLKKLHIVTVSQWVKQEIMGSFLSDYPITVIPNGLSLESGAKMEITADRSNRDKICLLSVAASWTEKKGIYILFDIATVLGENFEIWLVGSASEELKKVAPSNVMFLGYCSDKSQLFDYYRTCDLYVSASLEETFGMTFVESAFMGTRSVGFASTAIKDTLHMVNGICVEDTTSHALSAAIKAAIISGSNRLTESEIEKIKRQLSHERMAKDYMELYWKIILDN